MESAQEIYSLKESAQRILAGKESVMGIYAKKEYCAGDPRRVDFLLSSSFMQNKRTKVFFLLLELHADNLL